MSSAQRTAAFSRLHSLGQSFGAIFDMPELARRVAHAALTLGDADEAVLVTAELAPSLPGVRAVRGTGSRDDTFLLAEDDPIIALVADLSEPVRFPQDGAAAPLGPLDAGPAMYIPLEKNGSQIAVIGVLRRPGGAPFADEEWDLLLGLSGYAAMAIENAQLYQQAVDRTLELSLLVESSNAVSSSLDLGSVLNAIARHMMRALHTHWCVISGWNERADAVNRLAEHRYAAWQRGQGAPYTLAEHPLYQVLLESEQPFPVHETIGTATSGLDDYLAEHGLGRVLLLPLQVKGEVVGFAELASLHTHEPFTPAQIGHSMRLALELAPLLEGDNTPDHADLMHAARLLNSAAGANWTTIFAWGQGEQQAWRLASFGTGLWSEQAGPQLALQELPTVAVVTREQRIAVLRCPDDTLTRREAALFAAVGPSAQLILPLSFKNKTVGLVQLFDVDPEREFTSREMGLAHTLANQAAIALENAHLVRDLQRSLDELKAMQSRLVHAARLSALGELSTVIAHQINNPLTTIIGDAEMLVQDIEPRVDAHDSAQAILRAGQRAKQVVERLLTMAHMEDEPRTQDINTTIEETLQLVGPQVIRQHIALDVRLGDDLPPVRAIPGQLEDVWMNLLINARDGIAQARAEGGQVRIASRVVGGGTLVQVSIADNGCGISAEQVERIFDPFYTTKPRGKGTGLGLYICRQIVSEHHGDIRIESSPGEGTEVIVTLPADAAPQRNVYGIDSNR